MYCNNEDCCVKTKEVNEIVRHVFRAKKMGWDEEMEGIWFDSELYTKEESEAQFKPFQGVTRDGYPYTGYEYNGQKYHDFFYLGEYEDDKMPKNTDEYIESLLKRKN